ncbi:Txe/YoeB family addiction module toxin [uncultured Thiodictyon sp.]|uniref:Txe/YoeB family addiction module toxin n=1 Tax=uncultured Thiodictyon sp. TaxID=1846217 RepID=UPI0025CCDCB1|nr:Txe/YoeB family addiction module toxin [uncultured Thiodictyon sp.]
MALLRLAWTGEAWADYRYWPGQDRKTLKRINVLIADALRTPVAGIGKPEPLRENLSGFWSRRIDDGNRLVYAVDAVHLTVIACRYHY